MYLTLSLLFILIALLCITLYDKEETITNTEWKLVPNVEAHTGIEINLMKMEF